MSAKELLLAGAVPIPPRVEEDLRLLQRREAESAVLARVLRHVRRHFISQMTPTNGKSQWDLAWSSVYVSFKCCLVKCFVTRETTKIIWFAILL